MKLKLTFAIAMLAVCTAFTSCKKEYTCTCVEKATGEEWLSSTFESKSKAAAKTTCAAFELGTEDECTLK